MEIPDSEFSFTFSRSSGAGGQNVNKVNTKATMSWNITETEVINTAIKKRFIEKYKRFIVGDNVVITSQKSRSQSQNIDDCIKKLQELIETVRVAPKFRKATKPTRGSVKKRLDGKDKKGKLKKMRGEKF